MCGCRYLCAVRLSSEPRESFNTLPRGDCRDRCLHFCLFIVFCGWFDIMVAAVAAFCQLVSKTSSCVAISRPTIECREHIIRISQVPLQLYNSVAQAIEFLLHELPFRLLRLICLFQQTYQYAGEMIHESPSSKLGRVYNNRLRFDRCLFYTCHGWWWLVMKFLPVSIHGCKPARGVTGCTRACNTQSKPM